MEEMQRAFNKTIIKLQNTSRIAEEQVSWHYLNQTKRSKPIPNLTVNNQLYLLNIVCIFSGSEADRFHTGPAEPAGERH